MKPDPLEPDKRDYHKKVKEVIIMLANRGWEFSADDVAEFLPESDIVRWSSPIERYNYYNPARSIGSLLRSAVREGVIKQVGFTTSKRPRSRSSVLRLYMGSGSSRPRSPIITDPDAMTREQVSAVIDQLIKDAWAEEAAEVENGLRDITLHDAFEMVVSYLEIAKARIDPSIKKTI